MGKNDCPLNSTRQAKNESNNHCTGHLNICLPQNDIAVKRLSPGVIKRYCYIAGNFLPNSAPFHWFLRGPMKSNNETRISMFPSVLPQETLRLSGNKINCFPWDQSLSVYCCVLLCSLFLTDRGFS